DTRFARSQCAESAVPIAKQHQSGSSIVARSLGIHPEEILREENVFVPVPIKVGNTDTKSGRELRFDGQPAGLEVIPAVQEQHGIESCGLKFASNCGLVSKHLLNARATVSAVSRQARGDRRNGG